MVPLPDESIEVLLMLLLLLPPPTGPVPLSIGAAEVEEARAIVPLELALEVGPAFEAPAAEAGGSTVVGPLKCIGCLPVNMSGVTT